MVAELLLPSCERARIFTCQLGGGEEPNWLVIQQ